MEVGNGIIRANDFEVGFFENKKIDIMLSAEKKIIFSKDAVNKILREFIDYYGVLPKRKMKSEVNRTNKTK